MRETPCTPGRSLLTLLAVLAIAEIATAGSITVAWDPSPTPDITHYRVFVGRVPGIYSEYYDVGPFQTSFVYQSAVDGISYYFAVAAAQNLMIGAKSAAVLGVSESVRTFSPSTADAAPASGASRAGAPARSCQGQPTCYGPSAFRGATAGDVSGMSVAPDGRLLFIENGRVLRIMNGDGGVSGPVLEVANDDTRLSALSIDPMFATSHTVLVAETTSGPEGRRLTVARYREVAGSLGERATIAAGLPLPPEGDAQLAMDGAGYVYLALPADSRRGAAAMGSIVRLSIDGSVPPGNPGGMAQISTGPAAPRGLVPTPDGDLWVVGAEPDSWELLSTGGQTGALVTTTARADTSGRRATMSAETVSAAVSSDTPTGEPRFFTVDETGALWMRTPGVASSHVELGSAVSASRVAAGPAGQVYVALRPAGSASMREVSWIVRLPEN